MRVVVEFCGDARRYAKYLEAGCPDDEPADVPFYLPDDLLKGDYVLSFIGGRTQNFVGHGRVTVGWRTGRGNWMGHQIAHSTFTRFAEPMPAEDVFRATGFKQPNRAVRVPDRLAVQVWRAARRRPLTTVERAVEGATTESRSKHRDARLREAALARADGRCEVCRLDFVAIAGGLGRRCLVVHHKHQLRDLDEPRETKVSDLAVRLRKLPHDDP